VTRPQPSGGRTVILDGVSFRLAAGSRVAIVGPSGAGKTTLLRLINRLDEPDAGRILLDETDIRALPAPQLRRRVGMLFQQPFLFDGSIRDNLARPLQLTGSQTLSDSQAHAALMQVDLSADILDRHSRDISGGQRQRVALARALLLEPDVLLLDEPTSALDYRAADHILRLLVRLNEAVSTSMLMVSHSIEQAALFCTQVLALRDGQARLFDDLDAAVAWSMPDGLGVTAEGERVRG
jgi:ABC-type methionine transport system ATPase subunit